MRKYFNLQLFDTDAQIIDRTGAEALIPEETPARSSRAPWLSLLPSLWVAAWPT